MDELILVEPAAEHKALAEAYKKSYIEHGEDHINGSLSFMQSESYERWLADVNAAQIKGTSPIDVPARTYFTFRKSDGKIVGTIQLRLELDDYLSKRGGNIGYGICPDERNKGYGKAQLKLVLKKAKEFGIPRVMISCGADNVASAKTAISYGGVLTWEGFDEEDGYIKVFWIEIK